MTEVVVGIDPGPVMAGIGVLTVDTGEFVGWRVVRNDDKFPKQRGGFDPMRDTDTLPKYQRGHLADALCIADWTRGCRKIILARAAHPHGI